MRGGNGGSRSFLGDVGLSFVMIVLRKGKWTRGRKWICVAIDGRIDVRMGGRA